VREYDLIADWYASHRTDSTGLAETMSLAGSLAAGSRVLDIGCGNGIPLTRALLAAGHQVVGLDSSREMLARFQVNCPEASWLEGRIDSYPLAESQFDAALAWGVLFHLTPEEQLRAIANVSQGLKRGAPFLFTSGDVDGFEGKLGTMNGVTFQYYSFTPANYERVLGDHGFTLTDVHADDCDNVYYLAIRNH
jgi:SAM-dependent methyltransferase